MSGEMNALASLVYKEGSPHPKGLSSRVIWAGSRVNGTAEGKRDAGAHSPLLGHGTSGDVLEKLSRGWDRDRVVPHSCPTVTVIPEGIRSAKRDKILPRQQL